MGRRKKNRVLSVQQRVKMFRKRAKMRTEQDKRINEILQQQYYQNLNTSDGCEESTVDDKAKLRNELRDWANSYHISKRAINSLLLIFHSNGIGNLPKNYRTLQETPLKIDLIDIAGGKMWYKGVGKCLQTMFPKLSQNLIFSLSFNIDGLPLFNSSKVCFWPILASIFGVFLNQFINTLASYDEKKIKQIIINFSQKCRTLSLWS